MTQNRWGLVANWSTVEGTSRVHCSNCMHGTPQELQRTLKVSSMVLQLAVALAVLRHLRPIRNWSEEFECVVLCCLISRLHPEIVKGPMTSFPVGWWGKSRNKNKNKNKNKTKQKLNCLFYRCDRPKFSVLGGFFFFFGVNFVKIRCFKILAENFSAKLNNVWFFRTCCVFRVIFQDNKNTLKKQVLCFFHRLMKQIQFSRFVS